MVRMFATAHVASPSVAQRVKRAYTNRFPWRPRSAPTGGNRDHSALSPVNLIARTRSESCWRSPRCDA